MSRTHRPLPSDLGLEFSVADAASSGVRRGRLRGNDLERPFHGVRRVRSNEHDDSFDGRRRDAVALARAYAQRMRDGEFFSHETAAMLWGAPLPFVNDRAIHVGVLKPTPAPRAKGVVGHVSRPGLVTISTVGGLRVTSPASTWALLGRLELFDLVALGDFFVREWRTEGHFRVNAGMPSLATVGQLAAATAAGRRVGAAQLRRALPLVREDSWSRTESITRCHLVTAGLPEPVLNRDYFDEYGEHLGCLDLSYPEYRIAVEYQGQQHAGQYAQDIERIERLRAAGWIVIQVTAPLLAREPATLVRRVRDALVGRGWRG